MSVYLWSGEGLSQRNLDVLSELARGLKRLHGPWIVGGDWNLEPGDLQRAGWLELVGGSSVAPDGPTCGGRTLDFFVVPKCMSPLVVQVMTIVDWGPAPHHGVRLVLRGRGRHGAGALVRKLAKPHPVGAALPSGCLPDSAGTQKWQEVSGHEYGKWIELVEAEFAAILQQELTERVKPGRGGGPRYVWTQAIGRPGSGDPKCPPSRRSGSNWRSPSRASLWESGRERARRHNVA